jgi:hypothetical protein
VDRDRLPVDADLTFVGLVEAVEDPHQRRLAGAILAQQGMDLAGAHLEGDAVIRHHAGEAFDNAAQFDGGEAGHPISLPPQGPGRVDPTPVADAVTRRAARW